MATAVEIRDAVDDKVLARIQDDAIKRYSLKDGRSIEKEPLSEFLKVRKLYAAAALAEENGSSIGAFRFFTP